eukprot:1006559_1
MTLFSLLFMAMSTIRMSSGQQTVLYTNPGPMDPNSEDLLTTIQMEDNMFLKMDILIESFPTETWKYLFFIGDPFARVPDIWLWAPSYSFVYGFGVHFSRDGGGRVTYSLKGSPYTLQKDTVYTLEVCYSQTHVTTRMSGGDIAGTWVVQDTKKIHDNVEEPVHVGYPSNDHGDADVIITNLVIGSGADCSVPLDVNEGVWTCSAVGSGLQNQHDCQCTASCGEEDVYCNAQSCFLYKVVADCIQPDGEHSNCVFVDASPPTSCCSCLNFPRA